MKEANKYDIEEELLKRGLARSNLKEFTKYCFPNYIAGKHIDLICEKLQQVEQFVRTEGKSGIGRLIITTAPRHSKSLNTSIYFPAWFLGRNPDKRVVITSYGAELSEKWSLKIRQEVEGYKYQSVFGKNSSWEEQVETDPDARKLQDWDIKNHAGGLTAVGVGGALTGKGAHVLVLDDVHKDREEADSDTIRNKVWDWYTGVARTRLMRGGAIVVIACMTGDTPVLMADGTEKELRDIRRGDSVATFDNGKLSVTRVNNFTSSGHDTIYKITTTSGRMVRANKRHPFLTYYNGKLEWTKTKNLTTAHKIVTVKDSGVSGRERLASSAMSQSVQGDTAKSTTSERSGLMGIAHRLITSVTCGIESLSTGMESLLTNMMPWLRVRAESVRYVDSHPERTSELIGMDNYVLTTATTQERSEPYFVTTATSQSDTQRQPKLPKKLQDTSDFTLEDIYSIEEDGNEEVFDVEIEGTENFIANGVVSHNTRWHEDDLIGRLLEQQGEKWEHINLPALAEEDDILGRAPGEALWPAVFDEKMLEEIKADVGPRDWAALYQQRPTSADGEVFKDEWFTFGKLPNKEDISRCYQVWDTALTEKSEGDYSVGVNVLVTRDGLFISDIVRGRFSFPELKRKMMQFHTVWNDVFRVSRIYIENKGSGQSAVQSLKKDTSLPVIPINVEKDFGKSKLQRANAAAGYIESGRVYFREHAIWIDDMKKEMLAFPRGKHDDIVDTISYAILLSQGGGKAPKRMMNKTSIVNRMNRHQRIMGLEWGS